MGAYKWDRELLHRAVDLGLEAMRLGRTIRFDFPYYGTRGVYINEVYLWRHKSEKACSYKTARSNEALKSMLDELEKELQNGKELKGE